MLSCSCIVVVFAVIGWVRSVALMCVCMWFCMSVITCSQVTMFGGIMFAIAGSCGFCCTASIAAMGSVCGCVVRADPYVSNVPSPNLDMMVSYRSGVRVVIGVMNMGSDVHSSFVDVMFGMMVVRSDSMNVLLGAVGGGGVGGVDGGVAVAVVGGLLLTLHDGGGGAVALCVDCCCMAWLMQSRMD